jgi:hypothetical protein
VLNSMLTQTDAASIFLRSRLTRALPIMVWGLTALLCGSARAQDSARVQPVNQNTNQEADASVHAGVDERAKGQPQPAPSKQPTTHSRWGFQSADPRQVNQFRPTQNSAAATDSQGGSGNGGSPAPLGPSFERRPQASAAAVWPARTSDSPFTPALARSSRRATLGTPSWKATAFAGAPVDQVRESPKASRPFQSKVWPPPAQPQSDGFSTPFGGKQFGAGVGDSGSMFSGLPNAFPKRSEPATPRRPKVKPRKNTLQPETTAPVRKDSLAPVKP